nr:TPA_inf: conotoxin precursor Ggeo03 [Conus judaeus]
MKMYLCVAIVLLLASAIAGSALDKTETARNWGREERDEEQCPECKCNNLKEGLCVDSTECSNKTCQKEDCENDNCKCYYFHLGRCISTSNCKDTVC